MDEREKKKMCSDEKRVCIFLSVETCTFIQDCLLSGFFGRKNGCEWNGIPDFNNVVQKIRFRLWNPNSSIFVNILVLSSAVMLAQTVFLFALHFTFLYQSSVAAAGYALHVLMYKSWLWFHLHCGSLENFSFVSADTYLPSSVNTQTLPLCVSVCNERDFHFLHLLSVRERSHCLFWRRFLFPSCLLRTP